MKLTPRIRRAAVTLTELLVVLVIVSILSTVALPVYVNQAERARISAAKHDLYELGQAMETCGVVHGLYVPLQVLDDLPGIGGSDQASNADTIKGESEVMSINFNIIYSLLLSGDVNNTLSSSSDDPRTAQLVNGWQGPFINFQRFNVPTDVTSSATVNYRDFPLDPWGNPYRFYSPRGIIGGGSVIRDDGTYTIGDFDGSITGVDSNRFDRWAIVSWGPDGQSDGLSSVDNGDDIAYLFGFVKAETGY